ncbi:MAG: hypothetical protein B5M51_09030 [Anaerolinea sp. 4484_236]|nr:MAG: hypothetical protein B5M51_09030 [Anaerolinea sp. 4484_236]
MSRKNLFFSNSQAPLPVKVFRYGNLLKDAESCLSNHMTLMLKNFFRTRINTENADFSVKKQKKNP